MNAHPRLSGPTVRRSIEDEIERLITLLDFVEPDPDLEPYLAGGAEVVGTDDREGDASDDEDGHDAEYSLGWSESYSQRRDEWERGGYRYIAGIDGIFGKNNSCPRVPLPKPPEPRGRVECRQCASDQEAESFLPFSLAK
ncbi:hypothetical protein ACFX5Q_07140 [Mesorhizobium sp. IMUNJ 23033]|uniref:hypothetical protein n=1 Tax=Mesorhizobium sp. IMUNJ 23033 TaxID=3378039 RepID=UPI00384A6BE6